MSLRLLGIFLSLPITITVMFVLLSNSTIMEELEKAKDKICTQNNQPPPNSLFAYNDILCAIGFIDPPLLMVTLGLIVIAIEILAAVYYVNTERNPRRDSSIFD